MPPKKGAAKKGLPSRILPLSDLAKKYEEAKETAHRDLAARAPPDLEDNHESFIKWYPVPRYLGGGGYGKAHLWLGVDRKENVVSRIVVKDCWVGDSTWTHVNHWYGNPKDRKTRKHMEIHVHETLHGPRGEDGGEGREFLARMFGSKVQDEKQMYRLYLQFCPCEDLEQVMRAHEKRVMLPEPFLWSLLGRLVKACLFLEYGAQTAEERKKEWEGIVHRDIKLQNVFLRLPEGKEGWPSYPVPVLADFGISLAIPKDDPGNPNDYVGFEGTPTWQAPETLPMISTKTFLPSNVGPLGSKTNVWALGGIIMGLMNRSDKLSGTQLSEFQKGEAKPAILKDGRKKYSEALKGLAERCTAYWPDERPSLEEIAEEVERHTGGGEEGDEDLSQEMRERELGDAPGDEALRVLFQPGVDMKGKLVSDVLEDLTAKPEEPEKPVKKGAKKAPAEKGRGAKKKVEAAPADEEEAPAEEEEAPAEEDGAEASEPPKRGGRKRKAADSSAGAMAGAEEDEAAAAKPQRKRAKAKK